MYRVVALLVAFMMSVFANAAAEAQTSKQFESGYTGVSLTYPAGWELTTEGAYLYLEQPEKKVYIRVVTMGQDRFVVPQAVAEQFASDLAIVADEEVWYQEVTPPTETNSDVVAYGPQVYSEYQIMNAREQAVGKLVQWAFRVNNSTYAVAVSQPHPTRELLPEVATILASIQVTAPEQESRLTVFNKGMSYPLEGWKLFVSNEEYTTYWHQTGTVLTVSCLELEADAGSQQAFSYGTALLESIYEGVNVEVLGELPGYMAKRAAKVMHFRLREADGQQYLGQQYYVIREGKLYLISFSYPASLDKNQLFQQGIDAYLAEVVLL